MSVRDVVNTLQQPVPDLETLLALLSAPLACLGLLPPQYRRSNYAQLPANSIDVQKHVPSIQRALLDHVLPSWDTALEEAQASHLADQYFSPGSFMFASPAAGDVATVAYSTILSGPLTRHAIRLLSRLASEYTIDRLHSSIFGPKNSKDQTSSQITWEDCVRNVLSVPGKVANALAGKDIPLVLQHGTYLNNVAVRCECLVASLSNQSPKASTASVAYLLAKLASQGVFPPSPPVSRTQPSFFEATSSAIRMRLNSTNSDEYSSFWSSLLLAVPSSLVLQSILTSLVGSTLAPQNAVDESPRARGAVKQEAQFVVAITGRITPEKGELWESACAMILRRNWGIGMARIFVCWFLTGNQDTVKVLDALIQAIVDVWSSPDHVKHSLLSQHQYLTSLLLIAISSLPPQSQYLESLAFSPAFISGIGIYISHLDASVRRCGMLAAEVVAKLTDKNLDFGDWSGNDSGKPWARDLRKLLEARDIDADLSYLEGSEPDIVEPDEPGKLTTSSSLNIAGRLTIKDLNDGYDSDDSMIGYASPSSSRSPSPTPSDLANIEKEPSLNVGVKRVPRPVYLAQLGDLLRGTGEKRSDTPHEADKIEMALNNAEELIRKKAGYGTELEENAVNLVYGLIVLQDNYELKDFQVKRQNALTALVACCPGKAAPSLIEEFFKNQYSTDQRYVALNALALGAREMASLPVPSEASTENLSFPSKMLPAHLHRRYLTTERSNQILQIMDSISTNAIGKGKTGTPERPPEIVRERRLRVRKLPKVVEVSSSALVPASPWTPQRIPFVDVAMEYFITPLINRFWLFLRDEQAREERTAHRTGRERYYGAGTGLILNAVVLSQLLRTVAILVHAAQNAPEWLAIVAPETLEFSVTIGTRPVSHLESEGDEDEDGDSKGGKEAAVMTAALELALVVLDGCLELDGGRSMGLEHTTLLLGAGEWALGVFSALEKGMKMSGGGGGHEVALRKAAAGVLLKVDELTSKWRRSMLDTR